MYQCEGASRDYSTQTEYQPAMQLRNGGLPVELFHKIFSYLDERALEVTARTCRSLNLIAELLLWKGRCASRELSTAILSEQSPFIYKAALKTYSMMQQRLLEIKNNTFIHPNAYEALLDFEIAGIKQSAIESREKLFKEIVSEIEKNKNLFLAIYTMEVIRSSTFEKKVVKSFVKEFDGILETMAHQDTFDTDFLKNLKIVCERWQSHLSNFKTRYCNWNFDLSPAHTMVAEDLFENELRRNEERIKKISSLLLSITENDMLQNDHFLSDVG